MNDELLRERQKAADGRFYIYEERRGRYGESKYRFTVCDSEQPKGKKPMAKFKVRLHAERFLGMVRLAYVKKGRRSA